MKKWTLACVASALVVATAAFADPPEATDATAEPAVAEEAAPVEAAAPAEAEVARPHRPADTRT